MIYYQFAPNLFMSEDLYFGDYRRDIVFDLLLSIDTNFSKCLGTLPFDTCNCFIVYHPEHPMCSKFEHDHVIHLNTSENYWAQWVYQFAHEYCHHLINGELSSEISGLIWFEECICELSSMYHLHLLYTQWKNNYNPLKTNFAPSILNYLNGLFPENPQLFSATLHQGFLSLWEQILFDSKYHRGHYNAIATRIFPLFVANPSLWKIILHFGDMRKWNSLPELFEHLHQTSDNSYVQSLSQLENLLLS